MLIGVELDDTRVIAVAVPEDGVVHARAQAAVEVGIEAAARAALKQLQPSGEVEHIGFASSIPNDDATATVVAIRQPLTVTTASIASGTAAAVAESWIGAAQGAGHVALFSVGDRTSGGFVRGGQPILGARGRAGAVGWMSLNPVEREDYRKIGCLEAEVAASGIVRRLIWRIKAGDRSEVQDAVDNELSTITMAHILDAARKGDGVSISVIRDTAKYLGIRRDIAARAVQRSSRPPAWWHRRPTGARPVRRKSVAACRAMLDGLHRSGDAWRRRRGDRCRANRDDAP